MRPFFTVKEDLRSEDHLCLCVPLMTESCRHAQSSERFGILPYLDTGSRLPASDIKSYLICALAQISFVSRRSSQNKRQKKCDWVMAGWLEQRRERNCGVVFLQTYTSTETSSEVHCGPNVQQHISTVGVGGLTPPWHEIRQVGMSIVQNGQQTQGTFPLS